MPRGFSKEESEHYRNKLIDIGSNLFALRGLSGVSIDQIVKEVGIAKGSFYKFFKNKEDLCYDCLMKLEKDIRVDIENKYKNFNGDQGALMKELILEMPIIMNSHPLISIFYNKKELEAIMLRIDPKKHDDNFSGDSIFLGNLTKGTTITEKADLNSITALLWSIVLLSFNEDFFNGQFKNVLTLLSDMANSHFKK